MDTTFNLLFVIFIGLVLVGLVLYTAITVNRIMNDLAKDITKNKDKNAK